MKIKLDDKHYLNSDRFSCWITCEYTPEKKDGTLGKPTERRVSGYYRDFNEVVEDYIDKKINSSEALKISQLSKEIKKLKKTVKDWKVNISEQE